MDEHNSETEFMREVIKQRPLNRTKLARKTLITAAMAVVFSLVACITFLLLEPVISNWLYPREKAQIVEFPEEEKEVLPEEMLVTDSEEALLGPDVPEEQRELIEKVISGMDIPLDTESYADLYDSLGDLAKQASAGMVTITSVSSDMDWFNNLYESKGQISGAMIADNGLERLILVNAKSMPEEDEIALTFSNGKSAVGKMKQRDSATGFEIIAVSHSVFTQEEWGQLPIIPLGNSEAGVLTGKPVIAIGSPMGIPDSICHGIITSASGLVAEEDRNYRRLTVNSYGSNIGSGILINMQGQMVGIISMDGQDDSYAPMLTGVGVGEMKKVIEKMSNGIMIPHIGIKGMDVSMDAHTNLGVPYGAYITEIIMGSAAMKAGLQSGDIIVGFDTADVLSYREFSNVLLDNRSGSTHTIKVKRQVQGYDYREIEVEISLE